MKYLVANWKANKTIAQAEEWLYQVLSIKYQVSNNLEIVIAPPFTVLPFLKETEHPFKLAAQNISPFHSGAYTGEVSAEMLNGLIDYALVGHSERRKYFNETDKTVAKKVKMALKYEITPIVCLDKPYLKSQIQQLNKEAIEQSLFAYEPLSAIGSGKPDTPQNANQVAEEIKKITRQAPVLYGGSVEAQNAQEFILEKNIDGLLVGTASLKAKEFIKIIQAL